MTLSGADNAVQKSQFRCYLAENLPAKSIVVVESDAKLKWSSSVLEKPGC